MADEQTKQSGTVPQPNGGPRLNMEQILRAMGLGIAPGAPRLPEPALANGQFGGYSKGYANNRGFRGALGFSMLRQTAWRSPLLSAILSTRTQQVARFSVPARNTKPNEVGFRVIHKRHHDKDFKVPERFNQLCREVEDMLTKPWRVFVSERDEYRDVEPSMMSLLSRLTDDSLIINRPVIELGLDPARVPRAMGAIDGANVIPTFAAMKYLTTQNRDLPKDFWQTGEARDLGRLLQIASDKYKINLDEKTEWIYMLYGKPTAGFRNDELLVAPMLPTTDVKSAGFPKSMVEKAIFSILAEIMVMSANSRYFEFGSMAEVLIALKGNWQDEHIKGLADIFQGNLQGVPGMFRMPLVAVPGSAKDDIQVIPLKQNHKDMLFDVYVQKLTNLACAVFRMHPSEINEAPRAGDNKGALQQASQEVQISMAQEQGLELLLLHLRVGVFNPILERIDPNLQLEFDTGENELAKLELSEKQKGLYTVNERRIKMGDNPLPDGDERGDVIADPAIVQVMQIQMQMEQLKQQAEQQKEQAKQQAAAGAQPGAPGQPGPGAPEPEPGPPEPESDDQFMKRTAEGARQKAGRR